MYGGRWNPPGLPLAYCATSVSLAVLELLVHAGPEAVPDDLCLVRILVPDDLAVRKVELASLPADWRQESGKAALRRLGQAWAQGMESAVLRVPSVVVPQEHNLLIQPRHPDCSRIAILGRDPFPLDPRLFRP